MLKVCCLNIKENLENNKLEELAKYLSSDKREKIKRFHQLEDYRRSLFADILIRYMICKITRKEFAKIVFDYNKYGKPFLIGEPNIQFNVSHSGDWVVAVVNSFPIGIDIEKIRPIELRIGKRFFTNKEYEYIMNKNPISRLEYFYEIWTLKESYIKAAGMGLSIPLDSFNICINDNSISIETENEFKNYNFRQYNIDCNYKMAICHAKKDVDEEVNVFELNQFYTKELTNIINS